MIEINNQYPFIGMKTRAKPQKQKKRPSLERFSQERAG
jgi:hypothetical protein